MTTPLRVRLRPAELRAFAGYLRERGHHLDVAGRMERASIRKRRGRKGSDPLIAEFTLTEWNRPTAHAAAWEAIEWCFRTDEDPGNHELLLEAANLITRAATLRPYRPTKNGLQGKAALVELFDAEVAAERTAVGRRQTLLTYKALTPAERAAEKILRADRAARGEGARRVDRKEIRALLKRVERYRRATA